jgi:hypothetical protein
MEKYCWYKDPEKAHNPRARELIEKRLIAMRTLSQGALQTTTHTALSVGDHLYEKHNGGPRAGPTQMSVRTIYFSFLAESQ